ncbi:MAG TPA: GlxA family transcriptional regulator [Rhizomicrobium sp.]|jgi:transcriptional regulator GlxA family with amidase domain|nr:GlxA family transcriptional regulator [Rhizomicrobium sp.]
MPRRIGLVCYDGLTALDLVGPQEVFDTANAQQPGAYELLVLSAGGKPVVSEAGLRIVPALSLAQAPPLDTILVPGGAGLRDPAVAAPIVAWLKARRRTRRIASVCTGIYALAATGLLDGRRATTHWRFAADVARRFAKIRLEPDAIFLRDGNFHTSAGVTAGIDLALSFVEDDLGGATALAVARELVVYLKRAGGQMQYSEPLRFQARATDRFADLAVWMVANLKKDLSIEILAAHAGFGARHFSRRFTVVFGLPPAAYVEQLRLDEARKRLGAPHQTVDSVAASVGYASADSFRRAFERRFGIAPSLYRGRFAP